MIELPFDTIASGVKQCVEAEKELNPDPLFFYPYLKRVLKITWEQEKPEYPRVIKIPKSNAHLIAGDYTPEYEIELKEPVRMADGTPIWFRSAAESVPLRFGYKNLDPRFLSDVALSTDFIHFFLGGASGHGKSVTANAILASICYECAPWEVHINLSDAKIQEFKKYGVGHRIPHIKAIAATEDPDFIISVLKVNYEEMNERSKIFGNLGISSIKAFRKKTGLMMPRVIIDMDEVESTFKLAGKRMSEVLFYIDAFSRLGRSNGYHLMMATQNMSSDIPKSVMGQVRIRGCLGAQGTTSEAILGNDNAADNYGKIGRLIVNTEVLVGGKTSVNNVTYQTPYLSDDDFVTEMEELERLGKDTNFRAQMAFYDEADVKTLDQFDGIVELCQKKAHNLGKDLIYLGYPAFVTNDPDGLLKLELDHSDVENILICSMSKERTNAHLHNISKSLSSAGYTQRVFTPSIENVRPYIVGAGDKDFQEARTADKAPITGVVSLVRRRLFLMFLESICANRQYDRETIEKAFEEHGVPSDRWGNDLFCRRASAYLAIQGDADLTKEWGAGIKAVPNLKVLLQEYDKYSAGVSTLTKESFGKVAYYVGDLTGIVGFGRDSRDSLITAFKTAMQDSARVNVLVILYTRAGENLGGFASGVRYTIFDQVDSRDYMRLKCEEPSSLAPVLALINDSFSSGKQLKFKRTMLEAMK